MGFHLATQRTDVHFHQVGVVRAVAPTRFEDRCFRDSATALRDEEGCQPEFGRRQIEDVTGAGDDPRGLVDQ